MREGLLLAANLPDSKQHFLRTFLAPGTFLALKEEIVFELRKNDSFNDAAGYFAQWEKVP